MRDSEHNGPQKTQTANKCDDVVAHMRGAQSHHHVCKMTGKCFLGRDKKIFTVAHQSLQETCLKRWWSPGTTTTTMVIQLEVELKLEAGALARGRDARQRSGRGCFISARRHQRSALVWLGCGRFIATAPSPKRTLP